MTYAHTARKESNEKVDRNKMEGKMLSYFSKFPTGTAYHIAEWHCIPVTSVRPRLTEMARQGILEECGFGYHPASKKKLTLYRRADIPSIKQLWIHWKQSIDRAFGK